MAIASSLSYNKTEVAALLRDELGAVRAGGRSAAPVTLHLLSYGRNHGKPPNLTRAWNCTGVPNPATSARKGRTGLDRRLRTEVMKTEEAKAIWAAAIASLGIDLRAAEPGAVLRYGFGCAQGKHRSVSIVEHFARTGLNDQLAPSGVVGRAHPCGLDVHVEHRQLGVGTRPDPAKGGAGGGGGKKKQGKMKARWKKSSAACGAPSATSFLDELDTPLWEQDGEIKK